MNKELLERLVNKKIGFSRIENGKDLFSVGILEELKDNTAVINSKQHGLLLVDIDVIKLVREMKDE